MYDDSSADFSDTVASALQAENIINIIWESRPVCRRAEELRRRQHAGLHRIPRRAIF
jgi:hypothetical protein